mmetsp:Transcript_3780/g.8436  ORF Transcript_3780/g.8436 Transcript_3780/m.8436 type:complete len:641 (-) Transcript_3780:879-2801(-)
MVPTVTPHNGLQPQRDAEEQENGSMIHYKNPTENPSEAEEEATQEPWDQGATRRGENTLASDEETQDCSSSSSSSDGDEATPELLQQGMATDQNGVQQRQSSFLRASHQEEEVTMNAECVVVSSPSSFDRRSSVDRMHPHLSSHHPDTTLAPNVSCVSISTDSSNVHDVGDPEANSCPVIAATVHRCSSSNDCGDDNHDDDAKNAGDCTLFALFSRWKLGIALSLTFLLAIGIGMALLFTVGNFQKNRSPLLPKPLDDKTPDEPVSPPPAPVVDEEEAAMYLYQLRLQLLGVRALHLDPGAPQLQATEWMAYMDVPHLDLTSPRLRQRYALLVIFFAMSVKKEMWQQLGWAVGGLHECEWAFVTCAPDDELVRRLDVDPFKVNLAGSLPTEMGLLQSLEHLVLPHNRIEGQFPHSILYSLTNLVTIDLSRNKLVSTLSESIANLENLESLHLSNNFFRGPLPEGLAGLSKMRNFLVEENKFEGDVMGMMVGWPGLERLDIRSNVDLEGTLHNEIGLLTNLRDFKISWTKTQGTIPTEVGHLTLLEHFSAHGCNLGGVIPFEEITGLTSLAKLDLGFGYFDRSRLPTTIGMMTNLGPWSMSGCVFDRCHRLRLLFFSLLCVSIQSRWLCPPVVLPGHYPQK